MEGGRGVENEGTELPAGAGWEDENHWKFKVNMPTPNCGPESQGEPPWFLVSLCPESTVLMNRVSCWAFQGEMASEV